MKLTGDPQGIASLEAMHKQNLGFMKALLDDVRSTTDRTTTFRGSDGQRYRLTLDQQGGELRIEPAPISRPPPPASATD